MPGHLEVVVGYVHLVVVTTGCVIVDPIRPQNATQVGIVRVQIDHAWLKTSVENFATDYSAFTLLTLENFLYRESGLEEENADAEDFTLLSSLSQRQADVSVEALRDQFLLDCTG